jgi:CubicO group peptidase (beta-lactamase class C family)
VLIARLVLAAIVSTAAFGSTQTTAWPSREWPTATPASVGLKPESLTALDGEIKSGTFGNVDHLFVAYKGTAIFNERYARDYREISRGRKSPIGCGYGCADQSWMHEFNYLHPDWHPYYQGRDVHTLQSVTKSVAATVIGIAHGRKEITGFNQPLLSFFKDRDLSKIDPRLRRATLDDLLTMRSGIEWHEQDRPLDDTNTTIQLERSKDWVAFTLSQPMDADPGTKWAYNSGGSQLMSGIIRNVTGRFIDDYADEHLFRPIGIRAFYWKRTPTGHPDTEGGLYLAAPDLARIGYLYLKDGVWDGRRILPEGFVRQATTRHAANVAPQWDYGYQWWLTRRADIDVWAGRGFGGQFLIVIPSRDVVAVAYSWNVFGTNARGLFVPLVDAILAATAK